MLQITISKRAALIIAVGLVLVIPGMALATHSFNDVADSNTHAEGIDWMADSGVSLGCGNGDYCPNDFVTRAQMGTFMYRLSGNDPATAPSVDASTLGGIAASDLIRFAGASVNGLALSGTDGDAATTSIVAPGAGFLVISASADVFGADNDFDCFIEVDDVEIVASNRTSMIKPDNIEENCSTDAFYEITDSGTYAVDFAFNNLAASTRVDEVVLNVLYVSFGYDGNPPG